MSLDTIVKGPGKGYRGEQKRRERDILTMATMKQMNIKEPKRKYRFRKIRGVDKKRVCRDCKAPLALVNEGKLCPKCVGKHKYNPVKPKKNKCQRCGDNTINRFNCGTCLSYIESIHCIDAGFVYGSTGVMLNRYDFSDKGDTSDGT